MAKSAMPKSKAKTAYGLLSEIRKLILEEPRRYDQRGWLSRATGPLAPKCGTVGCVGGWIVALKRPRRDSGWAGADLVLGLSPQVASELFDSDKAGHRPFTWDSCEATADIERGLIAHARRGAAHIARFQNKYAKQLKAKRV